MGDSQNCLQPMCIKFDRLKDFVMSHLQQAAQHQKTKYDKHSKVRTFQVGQPVWLSIPTAKCDPRWEGKWKVSQIKSPVTVDISDGCRVKVIHINRLQPGLQEGSREHSIEPEKMHHWNPPQIDHCFEYDASHQSVTNQPPEDQEQQYLTRDRRIPELYGLYFCHACRQADSRGGRM